MASGAEDVVYDLDASKALVNAALGGDLDKLWIDVDPYALAAHRFGQSEQRTAIATADVQHNVVSSDACEACQLPAQRQELVRCAWRNECEWYKCVVHLSDAALGARDVRTDLSLPGISQQQATR